MINEYRRPGEDANGDSDDEVVTHDECIEVWYRPPNPLDILIRREAAVIRIAAAVEARSTFHFSPIGGSYYDPREDRRRVQAEAAAQARREAWAGRHAAMIEDADRRRP